MIVHTSQKTVEKSLEKTALLRILRKAVSESSFPKKLIRKSQIRDFFLNHVVNVFLALAFGTL